MPFVSSTASLRWPQRLLVPTLVDVFFCVLLVVAFARPAGLQGLLADGDTGWHIRTGELILATGQVPVADPFSFTRAGQPWFAWEWGSDVVFALLWRWKGVAAVAAFCGAVISLAASLIFSRLLRSCGLWLALVATMAAVSASSIHYLARPHVFSLLAYAVALWILAQDEGRPGWRLWLLIPMTAIWTNLHAGFVAWGATLALRIAVSMVEGEWSRVRRYVGLAAGCAMASLVNPYGWNLHRHVVQYLGSNWIMDHVQEFQSPSIRSEGMVVFAVLLLAAVAVLGRAGRFEGALVLFWGFAAMRSARHIPLFALVAAPVVAEAWAGVWREMAERRGPSSVAAILRDFAMDLSRRQRPSAWLAVAMVTVLMVLPSTGFSDMRFPVVAVEQNAGRLAPAGNAPRVLTSDQWADYLIYRFYPRQRVFFDGRSDFFGPRIGGDYRTLFGAEPGWAELLDRYGFDLALLPHDWPLSTMLERQPGWRMVYRDKLAVLYARERRV